MTLPITIGDLRHRVVIERAVRTDDGAGGATRAWEPVAVVYAAIWTRSNDENFALDRVAGRASHDVWMRYRADVTPEMRITFGARVFDIRGAIDPDDRARWLRCPVEERDL